MRIPFDSLCLAAITHELQSLVGTKLQRVNQIDPSTIVLGLYRGSGEAYLLLSCDPEFARAHFVTRRPPTDPEPLLFRTTLRQKLDNAIVARIEQVGFDRILHIEFRTAEESLLLVCELMGKHSNLILVGENGKITAVAKPVGATKSSRIVLVGREYVLPPLPVTASVLNAKPGEELKGKQGASPFLLKLVEGMGPGAIETIKSTVRSGDFHPVFSPSNGAYPLSVAPLGLPELPRASLSIALEQHFALAVPEKKAESLKASLLGQLKRVRLARETAIADLVQVQDTAKRAAELQLKGELLLAYGRTLAEGASVLEAEDYEGRPLRIPLDPEKTYMENADAFFDKAKRAKSRRSVVEDQLSRQQASLAEIELTISKVEDATDLASLEELQAMAKDRKWLHIQTSAIKEERPFGGHRIRELMGPGGASVLYGENAESNDYLTLRIAKPDDYWLHIRGSVSAHVVIRTNKHPEKVGRELLEFAAKIAVAHSPSKHSGFVPVDYTLKKYVRKPRSAPMGTALYTHEKTLHVEKS